MAGTTSSRVVCMAVALLALLFAVGGADETCNVDRGKVWKECRNCWNGGPSKACCDALRNADFACICRNYWKKLKGTRYDSCADAIPTKCDLPNAKCHYY